MSTMKDYLKVAWFTPGVGGRMGIPVLFRGAPGVGKTAIIRQAARELGLHVETIMASIREPADFLGLPIPVRDHVDVDHALQFMRAGGNGVEAKVVNDHVTFRQAGSVVYAPPRWATRLADAGDAVGFMDEISSCPPAIQAALLRVILEGCVGDLELPPTVRWVAAANPTDAAAGGWDLAAPLANRFAHLQWPVPAPEDWAAYMVGGGGDNDAKERQANRSAAQTAQAAKDGWEAHYPRAVGAVAAFVRARPNLFLQQPEPGNPKASEAWPSPRSWDMAVRAMTGARALGASDEVRETMIAACVGAPAAMEMLTYAVNLDLPDPADVLDGKVKWKHNAARLDRTHAVMTSCAALLVHQGSAAPNVGKRAEAFWALARVCAEHVVDLVAGACTPVFQAGFKPTSEDAKAVLDKAYVILDRPVSTRSA